MIEFLYIFRDNPDRPIVTDVEWASFRFLRRFQREPTTLLVNPAEEKEFVGIELKVETDDKIAEGFFGVA